MSLRPQIIWLHDPAAFPYLREGPFDRPNRNGRPRISGDPDVSIVGYETPQPLRMFGETRYLGRYWWVRSHDPYWPPPCESVLPSSIAPGKPSLHLRDAPKVVRELRETWRNRPRRF